MDDLEKRVGHLFFTISSFMRHIKSIGEFKQELQSENAQFGAKSAMFVPCDLETSWRTLKNNRAPFRYYIKLCASFRSHGWIQIEVSDRKRSIPVKISDFFLSRVTLKFDGRPWQNNRAHLLSNIKFSAAFHRHMWIQTGVTVRKRLIWVWPPWPSPLTSDLGLSHGHHFGIGNNSWKFHDDTLTGIFWKRCDRETDGPTNGQTDWSALRTAWSQLKKIPLH